MLSKKANRPHTRRKPTSAQDKVFDTAELLEQILIGADFKTLLVGAQRVCKAWHAIIRSSTDLQRKLFFRYATMEQATALNMIGPDSLIDADCDGVRTLYNTHALTILNKDEYHPDFGFCSLVFGPAHVNTIGSWRGMRFANDAASEDEIMTSKVSVELHGEIGPEYTRHALVNCLGLVNFNLNSGDSVGQNIRRLEDEVRSDCGEDIDWEKSEFYLTRRHSYIMWYQDYINED